MDVFYDNLENFTEESTNAELREENRNLKIKIEEYATALDQLQKEFDTLLSEHKKLETNYSSLLKTARSEIERKTQIISKLNVEKDAMVLNAVQNRNSLYNRRRPPIQNNKEEPMFRNYSQAQPSSTKPSYSKPVPNESRREEKYCPFTDFTHLNRNMQSMQTRHLDIVNKSVVNPNLNTARNNEAKENIILRDEIQSRAKITSRRKSMPVFSMDCAKFSSDEDEVASSGSSRGFVPKEPEKSYLNRLPSDKPSLEKKTFGHNEHSKDNRSRYSKYDSDKHRNRDKHDQFQKYKRNQSSGRHRRSPDRRKASPERRRGSPDRNRKEIRGYSEEFEKKQDWRRRPVSPSKEKYDYKHSRRDPQRSNERHHLQDFEKYKSHNQDKYTMKHKMMSDHDEPSGKRMRIDSHSKLEEDRWRNERQSGAVPLEFDHLHMSCQSPDQSHLDAHPPHQTREIKLTASTQLEDPRLSSKKYALKTHDGKTELTTVESTHIDVKVINTSGWDMIKSMKIPDALLTKPIIPELPSVTLLQKPMTPGLPSALQKLMSFDTTDSLLLKPKLSDKPQPLIQKPTTNSLSDAVSADVSEILLQIPAQITENPQSPDIQTLNSVNHKPKPTDMPDILTQKPITGNDIILDSSTQKPMHNDDLAEEIYMEIDNQMSSISMETVGDVYNFEDDFHNTEEKTNEKNTPVILQNITKDEVMVPLQTENDFNKPSNLESQKMSTDDVQNDQINKDILTITDRSNNSKKQTTKNKNNSKTNDEMKKVRRSSERKIRKRRSSDFQNYITAKEIVEGDLELSDETSDNTDVPTIQQNPIYDNQKLEIKDSNNKATVNTYELKIDFDEARLQKVDEENVEVKSIETDDIMLDVRKSKSRKKSLKLKESKEPHRHKGTPMFTDKSVKNTEVVENIDNSLSMDQLVKIKENLTKELANKDIKPSTDKPIKLKDTKSKVPSKNKEVTVTVEKPIKKKETQLKRLNEVKDTVATMDKPGPVKKDNKPKELHEKKETATVDKSLKKKEHKTKGSVENKSEHVDKPPKKKNIERETKNIEHKQVDKNNVEYKTKDTKFNELFGDSSSLVSPEDLGLIPTVVAPSENYIAMFEDAQDALDINSIRATVTLASTKNTKTAVDKNNIKGNFNLNAENTQPPVDTTYPNIQVPVLESPPTSSIINQNKFQNVQSELLLQDPNIVKTVIISSGIQPQCTLETTETYPIMSDNKEVDLHVMQRVKPSVIQDIALQAFATSTPQKILHPNVQTEIESRISETRSSNESREASITQTPVMAISTNATNAGDEPDVTIFVKRRRKVLRKK